MSQTAAYANTRNHEKGQSLASAVRQKQTKPVSWLDLITTVEHADKELARLDRIESCFIERVETAPAHLKRGRERDLAELRSDRKLIARKRETMSR